MRPAPRFWWEVTLLLCYRCLWFFSLGVILLPCDTSKYRCGEERQAVMFSSKRVHPLSFLVRAQPALISGGSPSLLWLGFAGVVQGRTGARAAEGCFKSLWQLPSWSLSYFIESEKKQWVRESRSWMIFFIIPPSTASIIKGMLNPSQGKRRKKKTSRRWLDTQKASYGDVSPACPHTWKRNTGTAEPKTTKDIKQAGQLDCWVIRFSIHDMLMDSSRAGHWKKTRVHSHLNDSVRKSALVFFCFG